MAIAMLASFSMALAACGSDGGSDDASQDTSVESEDTTAPDPAAPDSTAPDSTDGSEPEEPAAEPSGEPVKIGVAIPLTGPAASYGEDVQQGVELAVEEINAAGGILDGRPIEVIYEDDEATPEGGVTAVQKLIQQEGVDVITGGTNSSVVLAEVSVTKGQILQVNMGAQADAITEDAGPWMFQINNTSTFNGESFNSWIVEELQPTKIAYMGENTAFNAGVLTKLTEDMDAAGIEITDAAQYEADSRDFTPILNSLKTSDPDVLYIADGLVARAAVLLQQVEQVGGFDTIIIAPGTLTQSFIDAAGEDIEGAISGEIYAPSLDNERNLDFVARYEAKYNEPPGKTELVAYEGIMIIAEAMDIAGSSTDYDAIAEVMNTTTFETPRGLFRFGDKGRGRAENFYIQEVVDGLLTIKEAWAVE